MNAVIRMFAALIMGAILAVSACSEDAQSETSLVNQEADGIAAASLARDSWVVDKNESHLSFVAIQTGDEFTGEFESFDATIHFDPANLDESNINVSIELKSVQSGDRQRDSGLRGRDWFDTKTYPLARFVSDEIVAVDGDLYEAHGTLEMRGVTKDVVLPFSLVIDNGVAKANGELALIRTDYGVGQGEWASDLWVGFEVKVVVEILAHLSP